MKKDEVEFEIKKKITYQPCFEEQANWLSKLLFIWTHKLIQSGNSKHLDLEDLSDLRKDEEPRNTHENFANFLEASKVEGITKFLVAFRRYLGSLILFAGFLATISNLLQYSGPIVINGILEFLHDPNPEKPISTGLSYVGILIGCYFMRTIIFQHAMHYVNIACIRCLNSSNSTVYHKVLNMSAASRKFMDTGSVMNHINVDVMAMYYFLMMCTFLFSSPFMIIAGIFLLVRELGWIGLVCPIVFFFGMIFQQRIFKKGFQLRKDQLFWTDKRSKGISEYFSGIRILKYYGWESLVFEKISAIRKEEMSLNYRSLMMRTLIEIVMTMLPILCSIIVFSVFSATDPIGLTPAKVYSILSIFNLIGAPMRMMIMTSVNYINAKASASRIEHFIAYEDRTDTGMVENDPNLRQGQIVMTECNFVWETEKTKKHFEEGKKLSSKGPGGPPGGKPGQKPAQNAPTEAPPKKKKKKAVTPGVAEGAAAAPKKKKKKTQNKKKDGLNEPLLGGSKGQSSEALSLPPKVPLSIEKLHIPPGELTAIVGRVGSGKTTLLLSILGQIHQETGSVNRRGRLAYIPQISWLRSATIRENILFESPFDEKRYWEIVKLSQLDSDLEILGGGDMTEIGEKGVNLSGGQKQRISIARALYSDADIFLIDDCFSALDAYVGRSIFNQAIRGYLHSKGKTILLVTNALQYTEQCDRVLVINRGVIAEDGSPYQLLQKSDSLYTNLKSEHMKEVEKKSEEENQRKIKERQEAEKKRKQGLLDDDAQASASKGPKADPRTNQEVQGLVKVEERLKGSVPWKFYYRFLTGPGLFVCIQMFLFICLAQIARVTSDWWLGQWGNDSFEMESKYYVAFYAGFSVAVGVLIYFKGVFFGKFIISSSKTIQQKLIMKLLHSPLSWFDVTPTGRIIARTTKDQDDLDNSLSFNLQFATQNILVLMTSIVATSIATPFYIIVALISGIIYYKLIGFYMNSSRQIKRLEANTRAPLITHIQETVSGISIIRAFNLSDRFVDRYYERQKSYIVATVNQNITNRWINLVTDLFSLVTIGAGGFLGVITAVAAQDTKSSNLVGLALSWTLQMSAMLPFTLRLLADTESNMNAVVRLYEYIDNNPQEKDFDEPKPAAALWPSEGTYRFRNLTYRYRPQLPDVIKQISFDIKGNSKIGIAGRTGCGKSTMTLGLLRILELSGNTDGSVGSIVLDNENVADLGLHELRHKITIIPQDPTLFTGTIKSNIDPFGTHSDAEVAECLKKVELWDQIKQEATETNPLRKKVYSVVNDSGSNFSLGQKQLICMARALIRKPKVLLMDEATASIDVKTDQLIQKMIKEEFKDATVITIAHRLNTIINYDKILVLDKGEIMDYDTPINLVQNPNTYLGAMIRKTGEEYADNIIGLARAAVQSK